VNGFRGHPVARPRRIGDAGRAGVAITRSTDAVPRSPGYPIARSTAKPNASRSPGVWARTAIHARTPVAPQNRCTAVPSGVCGPGPAKLRPAGQAAPQDGDSHIAEVRTNAASGNADLRHGHVPIERTAALPRRRLRSACPPETGGTHRLRFTSPPVAKQAEDAGVGTGAYMSASPAYLAYPEKWRLSCKYPARRKAFSRFPKLAKK
jgi:hypothetical protein